MLGHFKRKRELLARRRRYFGSASLVYVAALLLIFQAKANEADFGTNQQKTKRFCNKRRLYDKMDFMIKNGKNGFYKTERLYDRPVL